MKTAKSDPAVKSFVKAIYDQTYNNELQKSDNPRSIDFLINAAQSLQSQNKSISESLHKKKEFERC